MNLRRFLIPVIGGIAVIALQAGRPAQVLGQGAGVVVDLPPKHAKARTRRNTVAVTCAVIRGARTRCAGRHEFNRQPLF